MKKSRLFLYVTSILSFLGTVILYHRLPEKIPVHFSANWKVDGYGPKYVALILAVIPLVFCVFMDMIPKIDPKKRNKKEQERVYIIFQYLVVILLISMNWLTLLVANDVVGNFDILAAMVMGIIFILLGNYMPKIRPNYFIGIKTPWTLSNDVVWRKTHRFGGYIFILYGFICLISSIITNEYLGYMAAALFSLGIIAMFVYSYIVYRNELKK